MKLLVLDNYDSFTYNLVHLIRELGYGSTMDIVRNDAITVEAVGDYDKILLSPGPGVPRDAGIMMNLLKTYSRSKSILGICLGHQGIAETFGGTLINMQEVTHGIPLETIVSDKEEVCFKNIPERFETGRYHSWMVSRENLPDELTITATDDAGRIMGLTHKTLDVRGLQFHPESIMTQHGKTIMNNWLTNKLTS